MYLIFVSESTNGASVRQTLKARERSLPVNLRVEAALDLLAHSRCHDSSTSGFVRKRTHSEKSILKQDNESAASHSLRPQNRPVLRGLTWVCKLPQIVGGFIFGHTRIAFRPLVLIRYRS
jgi:hypothetical protein